MEFGLGYRVDLYLICGAKVDEIHRFFSVEPTGIFEEVAESPIVGTALSNGCYLVYINKGELPSLELPWRLSVDADVLSCHVNETVMSSSCCKWRNGQMDWMIVHNAQTGLDHLKIRGSPPTEFDTIRQELLEQQSADTDYVFDVPIELFASQGGMRYDEDPASTVDSGEPWEILERIERDRNAG